MPFYSMKNWKNRDVEFPGRRTLTDILTSTSQTVDVARSEGTVTEAGDAFDASTMNDLEGRIGSAFSLVDGAKFNKPVNSPSEGQVVKYSSGSVVWANESGGGGGDIIPFLPLCTVNGAIANFPDGANNIPVEACIADITPTQTGTGDPSPSNPRPITGFTECNISHNDGDSQSESFEIAFGDTIYGGTLNATTGVLTATYGKTTFDGSEDWSVYSNYGMGFSVIVSEMLTQSFGVGLSNVFTRVTSSTISSQSNGVRFGANNKRLYFTQLNITGVSDLATWQTWLSNNDVYVVYPLDTPLIIPLTTTAINTYYGVNNFSADTGDISVSYRADIQLYIDKKIAEI